MKKMILFLAIMLGVGMTGLEAKDLVAYFSATGNTQAVANEIARLTGADILKIEAADHYSANPYDDSNRIQNEAYNDLRPGVANLPSKETIAQYDRIFVGSPIWWHQPAMVVCTFLEAFDLSSKTIVPFFTYGATTYLNESMHKIYKVTSHSRHIPATLPEDLNPDDITTPGPADDSGIDMPGNARGVEAWLKRLGLLNDEASVGNVARDDTASLNLHRSGDTLQIDLPISMTDNETNVYLPSGTLVRHAENSSNYSFSLPRHTTYLVSVLDRKTGTRLSRKTVF